MKKNHKTSLSKKEQNILTSALSKGADYRDDKFRAKKLLLEKWEIYFRTLVYEEGYYSQLL